MNLRNLPFTRTKLAASLFIGFAGISAASALAQDSANEEGKLVKMNAYIECYNGVDGRAFDSMNRYQSWVKDMEKGPTGKENIVYGLYTLNSSAVDTCKEQVPAAIDSEPKLGTLDDAAKNYLDALVVLNDKINEANKYYERENYKDDDFAKGKEMHQPLVEAMTAFQEASDALSNDLSAINNDAQRAQLAEIEAQVGKNYDYWALATVLNAQEVVDILQNDEFDVAEAAAKVEAYEDSADALLEYAEAHADEKPTGAAFFLPEVDEFRIAAKQRLRRVRDNTPYSKGEQMNLNPSSGWMVDGSTYKVISAYNRLIDGANK